LAPVLAQQAEPDFLEGEINELDWLNFSGRTTESFERVGELLARTHGLPSLFHPLNVLRLVQRCKNRERRYDNQFLESLEACIKNAEMVKRSREDYGQALFFGTLAQVTEARFKAYRGYNFSSRWSTRSITKAAEELESFYPRNLDARFPRAIFNYYWGELDGRSYGPVRPAPATGSREDGLKCSKNAPPWKSNQTLG